MKNTILVLAFLFIATPFYGQQHKGLCNVEVNDVTNVASFGYLVSYVVQFKNNSKKTVDGIYFRALYYNNNNDLIKSEEDSFNSSSLVDPIASGFTKSIARSPRVKGASKVFIVISKVHYSDGSNCGKF